MKISIISLKKLPTFSESDSGVADFWKNKIVQNNSEVTYQPVWQTCDWGNMLITSWQASDVVYFGVYQDTTLIAYSIGEIRTIGLWFSAMFFVGGPQFLIDESNVRTRLMQEIFKYIREKSLVFGLFETLSPLKHPHLQLFTGQTKYLLEPTTRLIDLSQSTEEILADMKQKGRYNIKLAEKWGCEARYVATNTKNTDIFYNLLQETTSRDGFSANKRSYYENLLKSIKWNTEGLYFVYFEEKVIAAAILIISGTTAIYYYGASSSDGAHRKLMAPYLLQWEMIQQSKKIGCLWYDFLWIAPDGEVDHHLQWVTDFKSKFWWIVKTWPSKQLFVSNTAKFALYRWLRLLRKIFATKKH